MILVIIGNCVELAIDNPLNNPNSNISYWLFIVDSIITAIFVLEASLKIVAYGFYFCGSTSYIRNGWNIVDFTITVISVISLALTSNLHAIKVLRLLRVLRPLRFISRNEGLKISITAIWLAIPGIFNVIVISFIFFLIFGVIGINYFKGLFYRCEYSFIPFLQG